MQSHVNSSHLLLVLLSAPPALPCLTCSALSCWPPYFTCQATSDRCPSSRPLCAWRRSCGSITLTWCMVRLGWLVLIRAPAGAVVHYQLCGMQQEGQGSRRHLQHAAVVRHPPCCDHSPPVLIIFPPSFSLCALAPRMGSVRPSDGRRWAAVRAARHPRSVPRPYCAAGEAVQHAQAKLASCSTRRALQTGWRAVSGWPWTLLPCPRLL